MSVPLILQSFLNTPLFCSENHRNVIASVLAGKFSISDIIASENPIRPDAQVALLEDARDAADLDRSRATEFYHSIGFPQRDWDGEYYRGKSFPQFGSVALIQAKGTMVRNNGKFGPYSGSTSYDGIGYQIQEAALDETVKGIFLEVNSHGGAGDGLFDLQDLIARNSLKGGGKKPILAAASDFAYSAGYGVISGADHISVSKGGGVGSIGVMMIIADLQKAAKKEGVSFTILRSAARKAIGAGGIEPMDSQEIAKYQSEIDEAGQMFAETIARHRGIEVQAVLGTEGKTLRPSEALEIGLVDSVDSIYDIWRTFQLNVG